MQNAEIILAILSQKSEENKDFVFDRIYRHLFNPDFYLNAYSKIYANEGNMTPGVDGETIDGFNHNLVDNLIEKLKGETYYPRPVQRKYIPKKNGKLRPLGIPSFQDKLLQEVVRELLEAIYEPLFSDYSHGFRPNRSCQTALYQVKSTCRGTNWVIEGDINGFFDNIDHEILLGILNKKINDGRFIELIRRFLKGGYFEFNKVHNSLSGTPQGGIISPILANIYLNEFDKFMEDICGKYSKGKEKRRNPLYQKLMYRRRTAIQKGNFTLAEEVLSQMRKIPVLDPYDENYTRVKYVRYADDFLVCVIGSKKLAEDIRLEIKQYLSEKLRLELNLEKTLITNLSDKERVRFLGYEIAKTRENTKLSENTLGIKKRAVNETIQLLVPTEVISNKLKPFVSNGKSVHHPARINLPILDMINQYNAEIRGLYNYYSLATDVSTKIGKFKFYHYYSLVKTIARKEKSSVNKVIDKYGIDVKLKQGTGTRKVVGVKYSTKTGEKVMTYFNESLCKVDKPKTNIPDQVETIIPLRHKLIDRLNANKCELCGYESEDKTEFEVHHVRKLKDIKNKYSKRGSSIPNWVLAMSSLNRKTLIVCKKCHQEIHNGGINKSIKI